MNLRIKIRVLGPDTKSATSGEYMVWRTIEDASVRGYCAILNHRIVRASEMTALGYLRVSPPVSLQHGWCRGKLRRG